MKALLRVLGSIFLFATTVAEAQNTRLFENVLVTPQPCVAGQPAFATMVWIDSCDRLTLTGGEVSLASPNVIRVRAEFEGQLLACFPPAGGGTAALPFRAPAAGSWTIDFAGTVRYRTPEGTLGSPVPITLRTPPPTVVVVDAPAAIPTASPGALATLAALLAVIAWLSVRRDAS